jgi:omega-6 fatty acid desaturase (delta-12 desaturase)
VNKELPGFGAGLASASAGVRVGRELQAATTPFAVESRAESWWHVASTFALLAGALAWAGLAQGLLLRSLLSVLAAMLMVRAFITYHDYMHGAILRGSSVAWVLFRVYASLALTPMRSWRQSHNYHHGHVGKLSLASVGAFPLMSTRMWREATPAERFQYRLERHPLTVLTGYVTVFLFSVTLLPLIRDPVRHWDSAVSLVAHAASVVVLWRYGGPDVALFVVVLPMTIASALGSYLFFAQHSFKRMHVISPQSWSYYRAAMESSSYMRLNRIMQWFTGNIGYHHIHHLNVRIPFYRLPETMDAIPELQSPVTTTLSLRDITDCFRSCLWDEDRQRMVSYREAASSPLA